MRFVIYFIALMVAWFLIFHPTDSDALSYIFKLSGGLILLNVEYFKERG